MAKYKVRVFFADNGVFEVEAKDDEVAEQIGRQLAVEEFGYDLAKHAEYEVEVVK